MFGIYVLASILGGGLLLFSLIGGSHHDVADIDAPEIDFGGAEADVGVDVDAGGLHADVGDVDSGHDVHVGHGLGGELLLGLFRPRNFIFFLTAFGFTGMFLTWTGTPEGTTLGLALGMGGSAFALTYGVFTWLRRTESASDALSERDLEGRAGRALLPLAPGQPGRVSCVVADRELYLTARLASDVESSIESGGEVIIVRVEGGVVEVIPFEGLELPPGESRG